ncbi:MAG: hydroxyectoine utilization dehydratase EutB [Caldilineaceae bacterium]
MRTPINLRDLYLARRAIAPYIRTTPLLYSKSLSAHTRRQIYIKWENQQETGSFKLRGAANRLSQLTAAERARGVITVSTGNHGRGVATVAQQMGIRAVICVPELVLPHKVAAMQQLGAEVIRHGQTQDDAERHAEQLRRREGLTWISAFDDPAIIAGQGTIGLEILEACPQVDTLIAPLSGGGLLGGIAIAMKAADPNIRTIGVSQAQGPAMYLSMEAGQPVAVVEEPSLADSLLGGIGLENHYTFSLIQMLVDEVVLVDEAEIAAAMAHALREERQIIEGGGGVGIAALLADKGSALGEHVVVIASGGNVDMQKLLRLTQSGWGAAT